MRWWWCLLCTRPTRLVGFFLLLACTISCDKICQWLASGRWFSLVSSTIKTEHHDITEILLNTITQPLKTYFCYIIMKLYKFLFLLIFIFMRISIPPFLKKQNPEDRKWQLLSYKYYNGYFCLFLYKILTKYSLTVYFNSTDVSGFF